MVENLGAIIVLIFVGMSFILYMVPVGLWIAAMASGVSVSIFTLIAMRFRRVVPSEIINPLIQGKKGGISSLTIPLLESHYLSKGNVQKVVSALVAAKRAGIDIDFKKASAIDLAGRDVLEAIRMSVNPKVIQTPIVAAVAKDGIQVKAMCRVTVRTNLERLVGGAGEKTIIARVGEGIVTSIGMAESHKEILENPDKISQIILERGLDKGTAYEILSIDVADVDVGKNIGAKLKANQAEADKKVAQAKAEGRRAMAVAKEQEMIALEQEMIAKVREAEAKVPKAISSALHNNKLGLKDFYDLKNIIADTDMRKAISKK